MACFKKLSEDNKKDINIILDAIVKGCAMSSDAAMKRFKECKRLPNEPLTKFANRLEKLLDIALPSQDAALKNTQLRATLIEALPLSVQIVVNFIAKGTWDELVASLNDVSLPCEPTNISPIIKHEPVEMSNVQAQRFSENKRFLGKCHYCDRVGHRIKT